MRDILDRLGILAKYKGYRMLKIAVELAAEDEDRMSKIARLIYPIIAEQFGTDTRSVYKSIGRAIDAFWLHGNRALYDKIAGYTVTEKPSNVEFITTVASYMIRHRTGEMKATEKKPAGPV